MESCGFEEENVMSVCGLKKKGYCSSKELFHSGYHIFMLSETQNENQSLSEENTHTFSIHSSIRDNSLRWICSAAAGWSNKLEQLQNTLSLQSEEICDKSRVDLESPESRSVCSSSLSFLDSWSPALLFTCWPTCVPVCLSESCLADSVHDLPSVILPHWPSELPSNSTCCVLVWARGSCYLCPHCHSGLISLTMGQHVQLAWKVEHCNSRRLCRGRLK